MVWGDINIIRSQLWSWSPLILWPFSAASVATFSTNETTRTWQRLLQFIEVCKQYLKFSARSMGKSCQKSFLCQYWFWSHFCAHRVDIARAADLLATTAFSVFSLWELNLPSSIGLAKLLKWLSLVVADLEVVWLPPGGEGRSVRGGEKEEKEKKEEKEEKERKS